MENTLPGRPIKSCYVGAPAIFVLELECKHLNAAFDGRTYLVGSSAERPDWRDVDLRMILADEAFAALFPKAGRNWEQDARWLLMTVAISERLSRLAGLPVDFQFQPMSHANQRHDKPRSAMGLTFVPYEKPLSEMRFGGETA